MSLMLPSPNLYQRNYPHIVTTSLPKVPAVDYAARHRRLMVRIHIFIILLCALGVIALAVNASAQQPPNASGVPVFEAETAKDAQQDGRMNAMDERMETLKLVAADHDRIVHDEGFVFGILFCIGALHTAGLVSKFKTRTSQEK